MITVVVSYLLLACIGLSLFGALRLTFRPGRLEPAAVGLLVGALALDGISCLAVPGIELLPLAVTAVALVPGLTMARTFGCIDAIAIMFHCGYGVQGSSLSGLEAEIGTSFLTCLLVVLAISYLHWHLDVGPILPIGGAFVLLAVNPLVHLALRRLFAGPAASVLPDRLVSPNLESTSQPSPDLLIVYLEGLDRRFADRAIFGDLYEKLGRFGRDGITFTRVGQIAGTGWSLAGMTATQSGVPITPRGLRFRGNLKAVGGFMPDRTFLGDILSACGYTSHYVVGGEKTFGGIGAMYTSHQISRVTDIHALQAQYSTAEFAAARVSWFTDDQIVFDAARKVQRDLVVGDSPYALIVETIGPHGPKSIISRRNTASGRAELTRDTERSVGCLIDETPEFIETVRAEKFGKGPQSADRSAVRSS